MLNGHVKDKIRASSTQCALKPLKLAHLVFHIDLADKKKAEAPKEEEKQQKKRVKKDPNAPKKPMPPFFCY